MGDRGTAEPSIKRMIEGLLEDEVEGTFKLNKKQTHQLRKLQEAQPSNVDPGQNLGSKQAEVCRYDLCLTDSQYFLKLFCESRAFYTRSGYEELYKQIAMQWENKTKHRVILLGNAGTGKSWFQVYALKRLLDQTNQERKYDIIIRHVKSNIFVIDLAGNAAGSRVYDWKVDIPYLENISESLKRTLYFFEPGGDSSLSPLEMLMPCLSTLSPFETRIHEYAKRLCSFAYFWPWSFSEMWTLICDSKHEIDFDEFRKRYVKFGGILRHVLGEDPRADDLLEARLMEVDFNVLSSLPLNIDNQPKGM